MPYRTIRKESWKNVVTKRNVVTISYMVNHGGLSAKMTSEKKYEGSKGVIM